MAAACRGRGLVRFSSAECAFRRRKLRFLRCRKFKTEIIEKGLDNLREVRYNNLRCGRLAQLVAHPLDVREVTSSSLVSSTKKKRTHRKMCPLSFWWRGCAAEDWIWREGHTLPSRAHPMRDEQTLIFARGGWRYYGRNRCTRTCDPAPKARGAGLCPAETARCAAAKPRTAASSSLVSSTKKETSFVYQGKRGFSFISKAFSSQKRLKGHYYFNIH